MKKSKKKGVDYMQLGFGIVGGVVANQVTNLIEKQSFMQGKEKYAPLVTLAAGIAGYIFAPDTIRPAFLGITIVSGTEQVEGLLSGMKGGSTPPMQGNYFGNLGFVPQYMPAYKDQSVITTENGVVVR